MEDIRRWLRKIGEYLIRKSHPTFSQIQRIHREGVEECQARCTHERLSFAFHPFVLCKDCEKVIRVATDSEQEKATRMMQKKMDIGLDDETLKTLEAAPIKIQEFYIPEIEEINTW